MVSYHLGLPLKVQSQEKYQERAKSLNFMLMTILNQKLINSVHETTSGGLLAIPLADTLKQADLDSMVAGNLPHAEKTIPREHLWQAQTPQMFSLKTLHDALADAIRLEADVTDEASAMELAGFKPLLIEGATRNLKVTHPADWDLMQILLQTAVK